MLAAELVLVGPAQRIEQFLHAAQVALGRPVDGELGQPGVTAAAQQNYQSAQLQMEVDLERSPLLNRPTSEVAHPRVIFELTSEQADVIRTWGARYSSR